MIGHFSISLLDAGRIPNELRELFITRYYYWGFLLGFSRLKLSNGAFLLITPRSFQMCCVSGTDIGTFLQSSYLIHLFVTHFANILLEDFSPPDGLPAKAKPI